MPLVVEISLADLTAYSKPFYSGFSTGPCDWPKASQKREWPDLESRGHNRPIGSPEKRPGQVGTFPPEHLCHWESPPNVGGQAPVPLSIFRSNSTKIQNTLVFNILNRSKRYFAHVTTVTLSWRVQNIVVIGSVHFTLECFEFSSNSIEICLVGRAPDATFASPTKDSYHKNIIQTCVVLFVLFVCSANRFSIVSYYQLMCNQASS